MKCRICSEELIPQINWIPALVRKRDYICRKCFRIKNTEATKKWNLKNREKRTEQQRKLTLSKRHFYRDKILDHLGNRCNSPNCPIPKDKMDFRVLQIDHLNGKGCEERKSFSTVLYYYKFVYEKILEGSKEYQLLCPYCNTLKKIEQKEGIQRI